MKHHLSRQDSDKKCSPNRQTPPAMSAQDFDWIARFLYQRTGITLANKQALVMGRLDKRLRALELGSYADYFALLGRPGYETETTTALDLLTTNETYFFREPKHFEFLQKVILPGLMKTKPCRFWSAASSSGEEAYTIAMTVAHYLKHDYWEVLGTDISSRVLESAKKALYPMAAAEKIPAPLLRQYCLKGRDEYADYFLIDPALRARVTFELANLNEALPDLGLFEVIFLRNVMIYFDQETKKKLVQRLCDKLRPNGYLIVSHSETLNGLNAPLQMISPSIYQRMT